jgi:ribulose 1,5-bisphosphate synthetase/thiazole synthase
MITRRNFIKTTAIGAGLYGSMLPSVFAEAKAKATHCRLPAHEVTLIASVDVLIIGGTSGAVTAATEAVRNGATVFLVAPMPYPGEDICGTLRLWTDEPPEHPLAKAIFENGELPSPLKVKTVLEDELLRLNIPFLYSSCFAGLLYDEKGNIGGGMIVNRSGCQAIRAKAVIDATLHAQVVRSAALPLAGDIPDRVEYEFTTLGNTPKQDSRMRVIAEHSMKVHKAEYPVRRYSFTFPDTGSDYAAMCRIEQQIRDITWDADQLDSSDIPEYHSPQYIRTDVPIQDTDSLKELPLQAFCPSGVSGLYVLSAYAGISRKTAQMLMQPSSLMTAGERVGKEVARQAAGKQFSELPKLNIRPQKEACIKATAREISVPLRPSWQKGTIRLSDMALPIWGEYDMVVLGGGTSGAPAGISAARQGIKTLTLEYLHGLGGTTTNGLIGRYWDGFREGFTSEMDNGVCAMAPAEHPRQKKKCDVEWNADWKMEWLRRETRKAGGEIWFGVMGCGAVTDGKKVCGVVVATPFGRGVVLAKTVIDSTGSADIAIAAGASYDYTGKNTLAIQGAGLSGHNPNDFYNNTDWTFIDDTDVLDISRVFVAAKAKYQGMYDIGKLPQTRERRRVAAEHNIAVLDVINGRRYPDTISYHTSSFDTHGYTVDPFFTLKPPEKRHKIYNADVPLRTLLPQGLDGILVTGLGTGAHRDAMPIIRMQPCLQNQGYAVGYLVAMAIKEKRDLRRINMKKVQQHLVTIGNLPERVLTDKDNFPFTDDKWAAAAQTLPDHMTGLEILLTDAGKAIPLLKEQLKLRTGTPEALNYAHVLAMLGESDGLQILINEVNRHTEWDTGWPYTGMGQFGPCMSRLDSLIIALGNTRKKEAMPAIIAHADRLTEKRTFSHFRAVCLAFESIGDKEAASILFELLNRPGIRSDAITSYRQARSIADGNREDTSLRNRVLKELHLARALYRCGDRQGLGASILHAYADDLQNHYARHARGILFR